MVPSNGAGAVGGAAGHFFPMTNVAHDPSRDVTLADVEKLLAWFDRRWGEQLRNEHEAQLWWQSLWSMRRDQLKGGCAAVKDMPKRPSRKQFVLAMITGDPLWRPMIGE